MASQSKNPFDVLRTLTNVRRAVSASAADSKKSAAAMRFADAGIRESAQKENRKKSLSAKPNAVVVRSDAARGPNKEPQKKTVPADSLLQSFALPQVEAKRSPLSGRAQREGRPQGGLQSLAEHVAPKKAADKDAPQSRRKSEQQKGPRGALAENEKKKSQIALDLRADLPVVKAKKEGSLKSVLNGAAQVKTKGGKKAQGKAADPDQKKLKANPKAAVSLKDSQEQGAQKKAEAFALPNPGTGPIELAGGLTVSEQDQELY